MTFEIGSPSIETPAPAWSPGRVWRDAGGLPVMVDLPAGTFLMGETASDKFANDTERPLHPVTIPAGVALGRAPVTVGEFHRYDRAHSADDAPDLPVVNVTWHDAHAYCAWLTRETGRIYRLPSEAVWEYACRAGSRTPFAPGRELTPDQANFLYDEYGFRIGRGHRTAPGEYPANAFGLYDLHGNVCEWVEDGWHAHYQGAPGDHRAWLEGNDAGARVIRGGAWDYMPRLLRSSWRDSMSADSHRDNVGFRVATIEAGEAGI